MGRIKHTKNELKTQRQSLVRYERFLPMLQLKKQQLQAEIIRIDGEVEQVSAGEQSVKSGLESWRDLFSEPVPFESMTRVAQMKLGDSNIAGVNIPVFEDMVFERSAVDLFATPQWIDDGLDVLEQIAVLRIRKQVLMEQRRLIGEELRITNQRVNLFEKVKIPECRENIRMIRIFLGDEQTAGVVRGKIAKSRSPAELEVAGVSADYFGQADWTTS